jgi:hypothetical protein
MSDKPISPLRQRMIDDMTARRFSEATQKDYVRNVLASRLDAEDWRSLVNAYMEESSASIRELDAFDGGKSCGFWRIGGGSD